LPGETVGLSGGLGSAGLYLAMNFHILGARVEAELSETIQSLRKRFFTWADQHEVEVWDADVVPPNVYLFHT